MELIIEGRDDAVNIIEGRDDAGRGHYIREG